MAPLQKLKAVREGNGLVIWITGLAGSGKTTIGWALCGRVLEKNKALVYLDGDGLRDVLGHFGYDKSSRIDMAIRRANLARYLSSQGIMVVVTTISMFSEVYEKNSLLFPHFMQVYVRVSMQELIARDQKGLYSGALSGRVSQVVGMDIDYDEPVLGAGDILIDNENLDGLDSKVGSILARIDY